MREPGNDEPYLTTGERPAYVGSIVCPPKRPTTPREVWVDLLDSGAATLALQDLLLIDGPGQQLLGSVVDLQFIGADGGTDHRHVARGTPGNGERRTTRRAYAKLALLASTDGRQRLPLGTRVRFPTPLEVTSLLANSRAIPPEARVPAGVIPTRHGYAPAYLHLDRLAGPIATSMIVTGAAGSLKSTFGMLLTLGVRLATAGRMATIIVNSKGNDFLFADIARDAVAERFGLQPLREQDRRMYAALGYHAPPCLEHMTAFVPAVNDLSWQSSRPATFPRTRAYKLSYTSGVRHALMAGEDTDRPTSVITRQCINEAATVFADEEHIESLEALVEHLEQIFVAMTHERARWRHQFQATTVSAALRQLRATARGLGPMLGTTHEDVAPFPLHELAHGGAWVIDVSTISHAAQSAVIDQIITSVWRAKADNILPAEIPTLLLIDELNRFSSAGSTAARLAAIARDQRHKRFCVLALAQELTGLHRQLLINADGLSLGLTRSRELIDELYMYLPMHIRQLLPRIESGQRVLECPLWPEPLVVSIPYPSWLVGDEGLKVVEAWEEQQIKAGAT